MERVEKTAKALENNNIRVIRVKEKNEILPILEKLIPKNATIGLGGSVSLDEINAVQFVRENYNLFDRYNKSLSPEEINKVIDNALTADVFLMSTNAITEKGELYNVDGRANRVAALCYGPKQVIIVAGKNKIVKDLSEAEYRVKTVSAPKNAKRLGCNTPCAKLGHCISLETENESCSSGCGSDERICCDYVITGRQRVRGRITVILCEENLGY